MTYSVENVHCSSEKEEELVRTCIFLVALSKHLGGVRSTGKVSLCWTPDLAWGNVNAKLRARTFPSVLEHSECQTLLDRASGRLWEDSHEKINLESTLRLQPTP